MIRYNLYRFCLDMSRSHAAKSTQAELRARQAGDTFEGAATKLTAAVHRLKSEIYWDLSHKIAGKPPQR